jgi:hypothetical protein
MTKSVAMLVLSLGCAPGSTDRVPVGGEPSTKAAPKTTVENAVEVAPRKAEPMPEETETTVEPEPPSRHPGFITFVDPEGRETSKAAAEVPESIAWANVGSARVPVVRVETRAVADRLEITRRGVDGEILDRTVGRGAPRPSR